MQSKLYSPAAVWRRDKGGHLLHSSSCKSKKDVVADTITDTHSREDDDGQGVMEENKACNNAAVSMTITSPSSVDNKQEDWDIIDHQQYYKYEKDDDDDEEGILILPAATEEEEEDVYTEECMRRLFHFVPPPTTGGHVVADGRMKVFDTLPTSPFVLLDRRN